MLVVLDVKSADVSDNFARVLRCMRSDEAKVGDVITSSSSVTANPSQALRALWHYITVQYGALRCGALRCVALRCVALRYVALRCIALHYIAVHHITMHSITSQVRLVFNKARSLAPAELMDAHGGLMWRLGRTFRRAEPVRVLYGDFRDESHIT